MSKLIHLSRALALGATLLLSLQGCGGGHEPPVVEPPGFLVTATVSGRVSDAQTGQATAGVDVRIGTLRATSDADGKYSIDKVPTGERRVVQFSKLGYASNFAAIEESGMKAHVANRTLARVAVRKELSAATGGLVSLEGSPAQVALPAAGLVNASGGAYTGAFTVEMTPIDPGVNPLNMPGNFQAQGEDVPIESMGALQVELRDSTGAMLNLAPGKTATIRIPVPAGASRLPLTIPLYYFKESTGLWVREGTAALAGTAPQQYYEGTVSHFTVWNADQPMDTMYINGCVVNGSKAPREASVTSEGIDYFGMAQARTTPPANFRVAARRNSKVLVSARAGDDVGSVTVNTGVSDITLPSCIVLGGVAPAIVVQPASISIAPGFPGALEVVAENAAQYTWYRNGVAVTGGGRTLHLIGSAAVAGNYHVVITNTQGSVTSATVTVTVVMPAAVPVIATQPAEVSAVVGTAPTFRVAASGDSLSYQWLRNGVEIPAAQSPQLILAPATAADNGALFTVRVRNAAGSVMSNDARLNVLAEAVAPTITQQPANVSAAVGQNATFGVTAGGSGPIAYQWLRNGQEIAGALEATYRTPALTLADNGALYSVRVVNSKGTVTSNAATLTVSQASSVAGLHLSFAYGSPLNNQLAYGAVPAAGGTPVSLQPAGQGEQIGMLVQGEISNGVASNFFTRSLLFWKNGTLVRRDLSGASGLPPEVRLSTVTSANTCDPDNSGAEYTSLGTDAVNALRSWYVVLKQGTDGQCNTADDQYLAVRADMAPGDAPLAVSKPVAAIHSADGALTGWLVRNGLLMQRVNADFTNPVTLFTLPSEETSFVDSADLSNTFVFESGDGIFAVDLAAAAPAAMTRVATLAEGEGLSEVEQVNQSDVVVGVHGIGQTRLLRYSVASKTTQAIGTVKGITSVSVVTPTRVLAHNGQGMLLSFPLAGGAPVEIPSPSWFTSLGVMQTGGERVWQQVNGDVVSFNSDGTGSQTLTGSRLAGCILKPQTLIFASRPDCDAVMVVSGSTLRSYDARTGAARVTYGSVLIQNAQLNSFFFFSSLSAWGQSGILMQSVSNSDFSQVSYVSYLLKTDQAGLTLIVMP